MVFALLPVQRLSDKILAGIDRRNGSDMRTDLEEAISAAPGKAQSIFAMRKYRKLLQEIESLIPADERIVAIVGLLPPENTISHSNLYNVGGRSLLVTSHAVYEVRGKTLGDAEYMQIPLANIFSPPRVTARRELTSLGKKIVHVAIDEQRGGNVETHMFIVDGDESAGHWIRDSVIREAETLQSEANADGDQRLRRVVRNVVNDVASQSVADELATSCGKTL
jgi:hypothetical protein